MHVKPKKRLGQNFLVDKNIRDKIIGNILLENDDICLEIGSGTGVLTELLAQKAAKVYAVEIDRGLFQMLKEKLTPYKNVVLIEGDILKVKLGKYLGRKRAKVIGNIPYYISTPILELLICLRRNIDTVYLTVQKELARRITASPGSKEYGSLSLFVQYYCEPEIIFDIKKTSFFPQPKVDSSFLRLRIKRRLLPKAEDEKLLFKVIRASFNQRRKILKNSLEKTVEPEKISSFLSHSGLNSNIRPEELSLEKFVNLANFIKNPKKILTKDRF